jgi:hypothetical protein
VASNVHIIKVLSRRDKPAIDFSEMRTEETTSKTQTVKVIFDIYFIKSYLKLIFIIPKYNTIDILIF